MEEANESAIVHGNIVGGAIDGKANAYGIMFKLKSFVAQIFLMVHSPNHCHLLHLCAVCTLWARDHKPKSLVF